MIRNILKKLSLVMICLCLNLAAQNQNDKKYIVTLNHDTIPFNFDVMRNDCKLIGYRKGKDSIIKAKDILACGGWNNVYETLLMGKKKMFYKVVTRGELSLYTFESRTHLHSGQSAREMNSGVGNTNYAVSSSGGDVPYVRKKTDLPGKVHKIYGITWRKKFLNVAGDCPAVVARLDEKGSVNHPEKLPEYVRLYNEQCSQKK